MSLATQLALGVLALDVVLELELMLEELEAVLEVLEATLEELVLEELEMTLGELEATLEELDETLEELDETLEELDETLEELYVTLEELYVTLEELDAMLEELVLTLDELAVTLDELEATLDELEALEELDATGVDSEEELPEKELLLRVVDTADDLRSIMVSINYLHRKSVTLTRLGLANWCSRHRSLQSIYRPRNLHCHQQQVLACRV
jgi:chromosome segregation ATPase